MRAVAYCRVSTNKDEQLDSLEGQQKFFDEYAKRNNYNLVKIYADEGKSGTKMKNRTELLRLLSDAERKAFDVVFIKDVSRLARNTVDFLTSIRNLKHLGVWVVFVNYDQTSSDSSEFMLTMLSAIAQEESANMSKRVKFGKKMNAQNGRVPSFVFGYDKKAGDYFNLDINENEAKVVRDVFDMYVNKNMGMSRIANEINTRGVKTKRGCEWSQEAIKRLITNKIYIGQVINGKEEVEDFLTGKRRKRSEEEYQIVEKEEFRLISDDIFYKAQRLLETRFDAYHITGERQSDKHIFSKLIKCKICGNSFRRTVRTYNNTYVKWVCLTRNAKGACACGNATVVDESGLIDEIKTYFVSVLKDKNSVIQNIIKEFNRQYKSKDENERTEKDIISKIEKLRKSKKKYMEMYQNDVIGIDELKRETKPIDEDISKLEDEVKFIRANLSKSDILKGELTETFNGIEGILSSNEITNSMLSRIIERIIVDECGKIDISLKLLNDIGLDNSVLITCNHTQRCD
ncbi:serine recombinase [Clostridia bacterium]|nr:serine recombinase [Clostridia bacterium]